MELAYLVLLILAIIYVPFYFWVRYSPKAEKYGLKKYGPAVMLRTKLGMRLINKYSKYNRFWRFFGALSLVLSFILMIVIMYILIVGLLNLPSTLKSEGLGIQYALAIPGINPLLPIGFGIIGLIVAVCLHELAHGMQTASNGMRVDSTGLLHLVVPMGAFVEPNEEDVGKATRKVKLHLYAAGIATNFIVGSIAFMLFAVVMLGGISSPYGDQAAVYGVTSDSEAYENGIPAGAIIETVDGHEITLYDYTTYIFNPGDTVTVTYITENSTGTADITWGVYIEKVVEGSPADAAGLEAGCYILSLTSGEGTTAVTTALYTANQFSNYMKSTHSGEDVEIVYMTSEGEVETVTTTLSSNGSVGYLGISTTTSGMSFKTPNEVLDIARNPFYSDETVTDYATSAISYISGPFSGFSPMPSSCQWWYDVPGDADVFWWICSLFYWIFWLNIILGVSNAIPAVPFDGGFIFLGGIDWLLEKFGLKDRQRREAIADRITSYVSMAVWMMFILVIISIVI